MKTKEFKKKKTKKAIELIVRKVGSEMINRQKKFIYWCIFLMTTPPQAKSTGK